MRPPLHTHTLAPLYLTIRNCYDRYIVRTNTIAVQLCIHVYYVYSPTRAKTHALFIMINADMGRPVLYSLGYIAGAPNREGGWGGRNPA